MKKDAFQLLHKRYARVNKLDKSIEASDKMIKGLDYLEQETYTEALNIFDELVVECRNMKSIYVDALNWKGFCLYMLDKFPEALECTVKLLAIDPANVKWGQAASCLYHMQHYSEALEYSDKGLAKDNTDIISLLVKADCLVKLSRYDEAIEYYDKHFQITHDASILRSKALWLTRLEKYDQAIEVFDSVLKIDPKNIITLLQKIFCLCEQEDYEKVLIYCYEADLLALKPQHKRIVLEYRIIALTK